MAYKASPVIAATTETLVKPDNKTPVNNKLKYYYLLLGLVIGALISFLSIKLNNRQKPEKNQDLIKQIKSSKGGVIFCSHILVRDYIQ
jgi:hypothetical protein